MTSSPFSWTHPARRFLPVFLATLLAVLSLEGVARILVYLARPAASHDQNFDLKYALATRPPTQRRPALLFFGDSRMNNGLYPEVLQQRLRTQGIEVNVLNLASPAATPMVFLKLLDKAHAAGHHPAAVFLNASPAILTSLDRQSEAFLQHHYIGDCLLTSHETLNTRVYCGLAKGSYLVRYRSFLKAVGTHALDAWLDPTAAPALELKTELASPQGWQPLLAFEAASKAAARDSESAAIDLAHSDFERFAQACRARKIPIILVLLPELHSTQTRQYAPRYREAAQLNYSYFLDLSTLDIPDNEFFDSKHVNPRGALRIADALSQWLQHPPYRRLFTSSPSGTRP